MPEEVLTPKQIRNHITEAAARYGFQFMKYFADVYSILPREAPITLAVLTTACGDIAAQYTSQGASYAKLGRE